MALTSANSHDPKVLFHSRKQIVSSLIPTSEPALQKTSSDWPLIISLSPVKYVQSITFLLMGAYGIFPSSISLSRILSGKSSANVLENDIIGRSATNIMSLGLSSVLAATNILETFRASR